MGRTDIGRRMEISAKRKPSLTFFAGTFFGATGATKRHGSHVGPSVDGGGLTTRFVKHRLDPTHDEKQSPGRKKYNIVPVISRRKK